MYTRTSAQQTLYIFNWCLQLEPKHYQLITELEQQTKRNIILPDREIN